MKLYKIIFKQDNEIIDMHHFVANSATELREKVAQYTNRYIEEPEKIVAYIEREG